MTSDQNPSASWSAMQERGTYWGLATLLWVYRRLGLKALYFILYFITAFYFVTGKKARQASIEFLRRNHHFQGRSSPWSKTPGLLQSYAHFMSFARTIADKIIVWLDHYKLEDLKMTGYDAFRTSQEQGQGCLLIVSHLGNIDICRAFAGGIKKMPLTILVHSAHAPNFHRIMGKVSGKNSSLELIEVSNITPDLIIRLREKIQAGESIAISGDRIAVDSKHRFKIFNFLGKPASFAQGPFILGELLECPVMAVFSVKEGSIYHAYFHWMAASFKGARENRAQMTEKYMQDYVALLERYACSYPYQWFNFYPYWNDLKNESAP